MRYLLSICALAIGAASCSTEPMDGGDGAKGSTEYRSIFFALKDLRAGEYYCLWLKPHQDSSFIFLGVIQPNTSLDSLVRSGTVNYGGELTSFVETALTIERTDKPAVPGLVLLSGQLRFDLKQTNGTESVFALLKPPFLDPLKNVSAGVTFTSKSMDTTAYLREFYLMRFESGSPAASVENLPTPVPGWVYGLWVYDDNFFPPQQFLYGTFSRPSGYDSDSTGDEYPFPGGSKRQPLNVGSGVIRITYEPDFYGDSLRYKGASVFSIAEVSRKQFIIRDKYYEMVNIADMSFPYGAVSFKIR